MEIQMKYGLTLAIVLLVSWGSAASALTVPNTSRHFREVLAQPTESWSPSMHFDSYNDCIGGYGEPFWASNGKFLGYACMNNANGN
jgi:hypothetical protein